MIFTKIGTVIYDVSRAAFGLVSFEPKSEGWKFKKGLSNNMI